MDGQRSDFWSVGAEELLARLESGKEGLTSADAAGRLKKFGPNLLKPRKRRGNIAFLFGQFKSPIILILIGAAVIALFVGDRPTAAIILVIVLFSGLLGFWQERGAANAVQKLLEIVRITASVLRDSKEVEIPVEDLVPGDIIRLSAGDIIPADARIIESNDLYVDEATLTGETFPVEKDPAVVAADAPLAKRIDAVFLGTHVVSGSATAVVANTGKKTEFGKVSESLGEKPQETEFEHGIKHFGYFLLEVTLILVVAIFAINVFRIATGGASVHIKRDILNAFLFSLTLAVGLTPQLLPAIITINLAKGARRMADRKVIVKRMVAIENFGSMDVFCSDKTGTLTEGIVRVDKVLDIRGGECDKALLYAYVNSSLETGFNNPIDDAIRKLDGLDASAYRKIDEVPYDFVRKRLSILAAGDGGNLMTTKGAVSSVLEACSSAEEPDGSVVPIAEAMDDIQSRYQELSAEGLRTLGVAYKRKDDTTDITSEDETGMTFIGVIALSDPPKQGVADTIKELGYLGVSMKVITGDNRLVAANVGAQVGLPNPEVLTGSDLEKMRDEALVKRVRDIDVFAEVEPNQKETIIRALSKAGNVVGYMGDGINDAPALHAADVGISVDGAVDVAKEAADFVLLEKDLAVLANGVKEGRVTFANTMKYVFMATSANFGNMFSMAGASLFLKFLPLLPSQVLLTNLLTDFPEMTIATDRVDPEMVEKPRRWDIGFIRRFMLVFGLLSSVFDYATFAVLLWILHSNMTQFRTGWFVESVISASMIVLVIRTRKVFFRSRPGKYLLIATILVAVATVALPYTPLAKPLGFTGLPAYFYLFLGAIMVVYISSAEVAKRFFYRWVKY